jgi:hypothetical protein
MFLETGTLRRYGATLRTYMSVNLVTSIWETYRWRFDEWDAA